MSAFLFPCIRLDFAVAGIEQKLQDPGSAVERVLDPAAVPGFTRVEVGDPCFGSSVKRWSTGTLRERVG